MKLKSMRFKCLSCGECCRWGGYAFLYPDDVTRISEHLNLTLQEFINKYCRLVFVEYNEDGEVTKIPYLMLGRGENGCIMLDGNLCSIHPVKPFQCEAAPFLAEFLLDDEGAKAFADNCRGLGRGPKFDIAEQRYRLSVQNDRDGDYEESLAAHNWNLAELLGVSLPEPEVIESCGVIIDDEEYNED